MYTPDLFGTPEVSDIDISTAMRENYLAYANAVISGRAIPHVADGLKPVHRRSLFVMHHLANRTYKKSARVVGEILGKFHPHGDSALYEAIVRMAQPFSMRYPLIDGQGNFGSVDGDAAAAMRYTEVRLTPIADILLKHSRASVVDFTLNYDGTETEPVLLGAGFPNILANGADGIAVGIAMSIPPHNISDVIDATVELIRDPNISVHDLARIVRAPDFPTGGIIMGGSSALQAYATGRGKVTLRAKTHIEELENGQTQIVFTELPYRVNKAQLFSKIGDLIREGSFNEIAELRDESADTIRGVIVLKRAQNPHIVLTRLFSETQLQVNIPFNMVALQSNGSPKLFNLKEMLEEYIRHRREVLYRNTLRVIKRCGEKLEKLNAERAVASNQEIIRIIKQSQSPSDAMRELMENVYERRHPNDPLPNAKLTHVQAEHILEMSLSKLTILSTTTTDEEQAACLRELEENRRIIEPAIDCYGHRTYPELDIFMANSLIEVKEEIQSITRGDHRLTEIGEEIGNVVDEDFIDNKPMVVTLTRAGYIKATPTDNYQSQNRGGTGKLALSTKNDDAVYLYANAYAHDYLYIITSLGRVYSPKVHQLPSGERTGRGKPIINVVDLKENEYITALIPISNQLRLDETARFIFASKQGQIKSISAKAFQKVRDSGVNAVALAEDDSIVSVKICRSGDDIMLITAGGQLSRYPESAVRVSLRGSGMVRGIKLVDDDYLVCMEIASPSKIPADDLLIITSKGIGKITANSSFRATSSRGTLGVRAAKLTGKYERIVSVLAVSKDATDVMILSSKGKIIRVPLDEISRMSRTAHGVKLIVLSDDEYVVSANLTI